MDRILAWALWHLSANGWTRGSWRIGGEGQDTEPPDGCVKTCRYMELTSEARGKEVRVNRIAVLDGEQAQRLEREHGNCPRRVEEQDSEAATNDV